jgi:transcriptional regulator with XRE-family HTH domain
MNVYAVGKNIKLYCRMQNMTLHALADEVGVGWVTMSKWINGRRQITAYGLYRVSRVLNVPMERLMEGIENG